MNRKIILVLCLVLAVMVVGIVALNSNSKKPSSSDPLTVSLKAPKELIPSETFKEYTDPVGFSFNYPDNLSIVKNEIEDTTTYASLQLTSKEVSGSLNLKIADSKLTSLDEWLKLNKVSGQSSKEVKLGTMEALEVKLNDRLLLGALDQGILFTIEMPLIEEKFWMKAYNKVLSEFTFISPESVASKETVSTVSNDITFEGEEVIE